MRPAVILTLALGLCALLLAGCPSPPPEAELPPPLPVTPEEPVEAPSEFSWTETPALDDIPAGEVMGLVNGEPFEAGTVRLQQRDGKAALRLSDGEPARPTGVITRDTGVQLTFTLPEGQPGELVLGIPDQKQFDREHAYYWYPQGEGRGPMSVNAGWGCALEITEWTLETDPEDNRLLGRVSGRIVLCFNDDEKSWIAGHFEGVYYK